MLPGPAEVVFWNTRSSPTAVRTLGQCTQIADVNIHGCKQISYFVAYFMMKRLHLMVDY